MKTKIFSDRTILNGSSEFLVLCNASGFSTTTTVLADVFLNTRDTFISMQRILVHGSRIDVCK